MSDNSGGSSAMAPSGGDWASRLRKRARVPPPPVTPAAAAQRAPQKRRRGASAERRHRGTMKCTMGVPRHINSLPEEVLLCILGHLSVPDRVRARAVCRRWCELCGLSLRLVRHINLSRFFGPLHVQCRPVLTDQRFKLVLRLLPNLRKLELGAAGARLSRNGILSIGKLCPRLVDLDISCLRMSFRALESLCRNCPHLQRISVPQLNFREQNLEVLLKYLSELRVLELYSTAGVTGDCFSLLPASIRKVTLKACLRIREHNFCLVGDRCPQLEELCLSKTRVTSYDIKHIATRCPGIRHLDVSGCNLVQPEEFLELLPGLKSLAAGGCPNLNKNAFRALTQYCTKLEKLDLRGGASHKHVPASGLLLLSRLSALSWLDLSYQDDVTDEVLSGLTKCSRLTSLMLRENYSIRSAFSEKAVRDLVVECTSLASLDLSCVQTITRKLWDWLVEALPPQRDLQLVVGGTDLELISLAEQAGRRLTLSQTSPGSDYLAVMRDPDPWSDDSDSDLLDEDRFPDVFIDWLWLNNALWPG